MSKIEWQLDDGWKDDLVDFVGCVVLTGTHGIELAEPCTNVDNFLAGLVAIVMPLKNSNSSQVVVDLVVEPDLLAGKLHSNGEIELSYGDQMIRFESITQLEEELKKAIAAFLNVMPKGVDFEVPSFVTMKEYIGV